MGNGPSEGLRRLQVMAESGELSALCIRHNVALLVAHGSAVRPRAGAAPRDLDLAFRGRFGASVDHVRLVNDLMDAAGVDQVDVMNLASAGPVARARALSPSSVVLHESDPGLFAEQQVYALTEEMETRRLRLLDLELMAA